MRSEVVFLWTKTNDNLLADKRQNNDAHENAISIAHLHPNKSPRPDGSPAEFFKVYYRIYASICNYGI